MDRSCALLLLLLLLLAGSAGADGSAGVDMLGGIAGDAAEDGAGLAPGTNPAGHAAQGARVVLAEPLGGDVVPAAGAATPRRTAVPRRLSMRPHRRMQGASSGRNQCPSPQPATLLADQHERRSLNFTGDYSAAGTPDPPVCSWLLQCAPGTKGQAVVLRFRSLSTFYGGDDTPPLGAGDSVVVYLNPEGDADYVELSGPLAAVDGGFGALFEQSFGAVGDTMRVELRFVFGSTAGFAADYWCTSARSLAHGCTDRAAENFDASADADDGSCTYGDVSALLSAAFQIDSPGRSPDGWGTDNDPCVSHLADNGGWDGIYCHRLMTGKITVSRPVIVQLREPDVSLTLGDGIDQLNSLQEVVLAQTKLHGVLPQSLGGLRLLHQLSLYETALSGTIPASIGSLGTHLDVLDLDTTLISGTIPESLGQLSELTLLRLDKSGLSGSLPLELWELSKLQYLSLRNTAISGSLPARMVKMESLRRLHLGLSRLAGSLPRGLLGDLSALEDLDLSETNINGTLPAEIGGMSSLQSLALPRTQVSGVLVPELGRLRRLETLDLGTTHVSGTLIDELSDMKSLQTLGLAQTRITGTLSAALGVMTSLQKISMATTGVSGTIPKALFNLTQLVWLQLQGTSVSGTLPPSIRSWTAMQILDLPDAHLSGTLPPAVGSMPALTELSVHSNDLSGTVPEELGLLGDLTHLYANDMFLSGTLPDMSGCLALRVVRFTNNEFTGVPAALPPNLTHLYMDKNPVNTTGDALCALRPQTVEVLSIAYSAESILLESTRRNPDPRCEIHDDTGCRGTWVTPPDQCRIGKNCSWIFQLRDANDQSATVGGVLHDLSIGHNCSDPSRQSTCFAIAPMIDNRDGTFTATVPGFPEGHSGAWIQLRGLHSFHFFHKGRGFTPDTDEDGNSSPNNEGRLRSANFLPRECPSDSNTVPDIETGNMCICEKGFSRSDSSSKCSISCPDFGTKASRDGSTCECVDSFYDHDQSGRVACVVQDYPPIHYPVSTDGDLQHYDGSGLITSPDSHHELQRCLPCPRDCATCMDGKIVSKEGWRLRGSVGQRDLREHLKAFDPHSEQVLILCPNGSSYGRPSNNGSSSSVCPSFPLDNVDLQRRDTTCHLGRVGPLCQSCGPNKFAHAEGWCDECPEATLEVYGKLTALVLVAAFVLIVLLYLVSWSRGDMQTASEKAENLLSTWRDMRDTIAFRDTNARSSISSAYDLSPTMSLFSTRSQLSHETSVQLSHETSVEPSVGMPELFEEDRRKKRADDTTLTAICFQLAFQSVRIMISYAQVITQLGTVLHVQLPQTFAGAVDKLKVLTVDLSAFLTLHDMHIMDCLSVYKRWLVYVLIVPVTMLFIVLLLHIVDSWRASDHVLDKTKIRVYFILFLVYPLVCRQSFSLFNCRTLGENYSVLVDDYDLLCESNTYRTIAAVVIVVFIVGAPLSLAYLFWQKIRETRMQPLEMVPEQDTQEGPDRLREEERNRRAKERQYVIDNLASEGRRILGKFSKEHAKDILQTVDADKAAFFAAGYKGRFFYWESLDMTRKLLLVGMIVFAGQGSTAQCSLAVFLSFLFFAAQVGWSPCKMNEDNQLRAAAEAHIFLTCLVSLALKTPLATENVKADHYGAILYGTLCCLAMFTLYSIFRKIRMAKQLLAPSGTQRDNRRGSDQKRKLESAMKLHNLGFSDKHGILRARVERLKAKHRNEELLKQLDENDKRKLDWIKEELGLDEDFRKGSHKAMVELLEESCERANVVYDSSDTPSETVRSITDAIVQRVRNEEKKGGIFLSHYQVNGGPDLMQLKGELEREYPHLVGSMWYDKDQLNPSVEGMRSGVRDHEYFLAYLTRDYLVRPFCRKEIRWALLYRKKILLLWKRTGNGSVGRFNEFFEASSKSIEIPGEGEDGGGSDLNAIFEDAAINYYQEAPFHAASMATLAVRLGLGQQADRVAGRQYKFNTNVPQKSVLWAFAKDNGEQQVKYIQSQLCTFATALTEDSFGWLDLRSAHKATAVIVFLTETVFPSDDTEIFDALTEAMSVGARILFVAETEMAHGWTVFNALRENSSWSDGVDWLKGKVPAEYFEAKGGLTPAMFDTVNVIPFYKDWAFRLVSLQSILHNLGADETDVELDISVEQMSPGLALSIGGEETTSAISETSSAVTSTSSLGSLERTFTAKLRSSSAARRGPGARRVTELSGTSSIGTSRPASPGFEV